MKDLENVAKSGHSRTIAAPPCALRMAMTVMTQQSSMCGFYTLSTTYIPGTVLRALCAWNSILTMASKVEATLLFLDLEVWELF